MGNLMRIMSATMCLSCGLLWAQNGTINSLSVNPRQNQDLTNSTGTETGQPSDAVPGSESQENGLVPVTGNMVGSGSNANTRQPQAANTAGAAPNATTLPGQERNQPAVATLARSQPKKAPK